MFISWLTRRQVNPITCASPIVRRQLAQKVQTILEPNGREGAKYRTSIPIKGYDSVAYPFINRLSLSILSTRPLPQKFLSLRYSLFPTDIMPKASKAGYYAVKNGFRPGVYTSWDECEAQVKGFKGAQYKKFPTHAQALEYIGQGIPSEPAPYTKPIPSLPIASQPTAQPKPDRKISPALSAAESLAVKEGYTVSSEGFLVVYCDGSSLGNGKQGAKAGLGVFWGMDGEAERKNLAEALPGVLQTNNRGELLAIIRAIEEHPHPDLPLEIRTDSQYSISCMTQYLPKWLRNNFVLSTGEPVKNRDLLIHLLALMNRMGTTRIRLKHVKGHAGHEGNEMADRLANMGAAMPHPPDRTNWLTLKVANESAHEAWREKQGNASAATKNDNVQTTSVGDLSIEIEVDPDWMLTEEEMKELDETQEF